jgi:hypothetical protein
MPIILTAARDRLAAWREHFPHHHRDPARSGDDVPASAEAQTAAATRARVYQTASGPSTALKQSEEQFDYKATEAGASRNCSSSRPVLFPTLKPLLAILFHQLVRERVLSCYVKQGLQG